MNRLILFLFLLLAMGCKSAKKSLTTSDSTSVSSSQVTQVDSTKSTSKKTETSKEENEVLEEVIQSYVALDSSGVTVFKPTTTTRRKNTSTKETEKTMDTTAQTVAISEMISNDSINQSLSDLKREYEGENITQSIIGALIPGWVKTILLLMALILLGLIGKKIYKSINKKPETK